MKQVESSFAQTLLVIAVISAIIVVGFLWWDNGQNNNLVLPNRNGGIQPITPQLTPVPTIKNESINSIESDFNKIDSTQYESQIDLGQTQLGTDASAL